MPSSGSPQEHIFVLLGSDEELVVTFDPYSTAWGHRLIDTYQSLSTSAAAVFITDVLVLAGVYGGGSVEVENALTNVRQLLGTQSLTSEQLGQWTRVTNSYVHVGNICCTHH
jgi:hypothetical protein